MNGESSYYLHPLDEDKPDVADRYGVMDIETLAPENALVWAVGYRDENGYKRWDETDANGSIPYAPEDPKGPIAKFATWFFDQPGRTLYAHNGGNFDYQYLVRWLLDFAESLGLRATIIPLSSSIMCIIVKGPNKQEWKLLDSMRIMPMSLEKVAKTFGMDGKLDEGKRDENYYATLHQNPQRYAYLSRDVDILWKSVRAFQRLVNGKLESTVAVSAASTAMRLFRRRFQSHEIAINRHFQGCDLPEGPEEGHCVGCAHDFFRSSYCGGRVEPFDVAPFVSEFDVFYGDINSMYPAAMLMPVPTGEMRESKRLDDGQPNEVGFFEAEVSIPRGCKVPPLPYRSSEGLLFPTGVFSGVWCHRELELLECVGGTVQEIKRGVWIQATDALRAYVETLYGFRDKSRPDYNEGLAAIAKILLNSLYGKFGTNYDRESIWINPSVEDIGDHELRDMCDRYHTLFLENVFTYPDYLVPQIASTITATARAMLWRYLHEASQSGKLYYCDTDSIVSTHEYEWSSELGGMKLEKTARTGHFVAPKLYRFGDSESEEMLKAKGFGGFGAKINSQSWRDIANGEPFEAKRMQKLKGWSKAGDNPKTIDVTKQRRSGYTKRFVYPDGTTRPWHIQNGQLT